MKRVTLREILYLNAYWVGLSFMWNSLHVIILPAVLLHLAPGMLKNTYLGLLTFVGLVMAMIIQPISGALSDSWVSRWGRRRPLIALGTAFDFVFLAFLAWSGGIVWLAVGYIGLQISSNVAHGPAQGLLPDVVPEQQLGWASGIKNLMDMAGLVASSLLMGRLMDADVRHPLGAVAIVALILALSAAITLLGVREQPSLVARRSQQAAAWREMLRIDLRAHRRFAWLVASRFFFLIGVYGIQSFAQYYVRDVLAAPNPLQLTGDLLAAITLALIFFALVGGWLGDRFGHLRMSVVASVFGFLGCLLMVWARTPETLLIFGGVLGVGIGLFLTANWALANELAPAAEAGKFMGLTNLATAGAAAVGRLEGPFIDLLNNAWPGEWLGYVGLFLLGALFIVVSAFLLRGVRSALAQPAI
ncbi:MAG: MFS transporter [Anaerolineales bacterium]|nr:MFS transporter [Anaerolineales bacterium]